MARAPERARLEYQRSHLLYYRKHCSLAQTIALRLWLLARAELALLLGTLSLNGRRIREAFALLRVAGGG
jgi:hypothetical protein